MQFMVSFKCHFKNVVWFEVNEFVVKYTRDNRSGTGAEGVAVWA